MSTHDRQLRGALEMIAQSPRGCSVAALLASGYGAGLVASLIESGAVEAQADSVLIGRRPRRVRRLWLTEAGRRLLVGP